MCQYIWDIERQKQKNKKCTIQHAANAVSAIINRKSWVRDRSSKQAIKVRQVHEVKEEEEEDA